MTDSYNGGPSTPYSKPVHNDGKITGGKIKVDISGGDKDVEAMCNYIRGNTGVENGILGNSESDRAIADGVGAPLATAKPKGGY